MNGINTLESKLAHQYARLPRLPKFFRSWVTTNVWWIVLLAAFITSIVLLAALSKVPNILGSSRYASAIYTYNPVTAMQTFTAALISIGLGLISVVLLFMAVSPLKIMKGRGWKLLFVNQLVQIVWAIVSAFIIIQDFDLRSLVVTLLLIAVELYFMFQIREDFGTKLTKTGRNKKAVTATVVTRRRSTKKK